MPITFTIELSEEQLDHLAERIAAKISNCQTASTFSGDLVTAEEVAARLGCKYRSILNWREEGIIPAAIHRGNAVRFSMPAVLEALRKDAANQVIL